MVSAPRDLFQVIFGYGLSNKGYNGLPIDSNWLAAYYDLGLVGVSIVAAMLLFVLVSAYFQPRSERRALALFLVTYLMVTSYTETGLSDASMYLLELCPGRVAARAARCGQEPGMKVLQVHNRYRSATPSGENRVVDQEARHSREPGTRSCGSGGAATRSSIGQRRKRRRCRPGWSGAARPAVS